MNRAFLSQLVRFVVLALALFVTARVYGWAASDEVIKRTVKCRYCRKRISEKVSLDGDSGMVLRWCFFFSFFLLG